MAFGLRWIRCAVLSVLWLASFCLLQNGSLGDEIEAPSRQLQQAEVPSTVDGVQQLVRYWVPETAQSEPLPLLVFLHTWNGSANQDKPAWVEEAVRRNWVFLQPDFRGPNNQPDAGGSELAQQDILDAIDWMMKLRKIDTSRIYLGGASGGGHMALLMAGRHPHRFSSVTAWVPISDLQAWHELHAPKENSGYAKQIRAVCGGGPGDSAEADAQYHLRSPVNFLQNVGDLPVDIAAGIDDHIVPFPHSVRAFNVIAEAHSAGVVTPDEVEQLQQNRKLRHPSESDLVIDDVLGRQIHIRRHAGASRLTIFEGGHEGLAAAGCDWLEKSVRPTH